MTVREDEGALEEQMGGMTVCAEVCQGVASPVLMSPGPPWLKTPWGAGGGLCSLRSGGFRQTGLPRRPLPASAGSQGLQLPIVPRPGWPGSGWRVLPPRGRKMGAGGREVEGKRQARRRWRQPRTDSPGGMTATGPTGWSTPSVLPCSPVLCSERLRADPDTDSEAGGAQMRRARRTRERGRASSVPPRGGRPRLRLPDRPARKALGLNLIMLH